MVQPIDYTIDVINPLQGYMQGLKFGESMLASEQNRELARSQEGRTQETFAMAKQDRARSIASAQAAQQNAAAAQAGLVDYVNKLEAGTATPAELRAAMLKFPKMAETFQAFSNSVSAERLNTEITFAKQLAFALQRDPEQAKLLIQKRADAALASGDKQASDVARAQIIQIDQNPNAVLTQALMPLVTTMKPDEFDKFHTDVLGIGGDQSKLKSSDTIGGIASVQIMEDGKTQIVDTRTNRIVTGAAATKLLNDARKLNEKPLSGIGKLAYDLANENITQDQFDKAAAAQDSSGVTVTNVIGGAEETLAKELSQNTAKQLTSSVDAGFKASRRLRDLDTLSELFGQVDTGASATVKSFLGSYGIKTEGVDLIEAAEAIISRLVPTAREPGSGPMSDKDLELFQRTFPSLLNTPSGNALILDTLERVSQYEVAEGIIAGKVMDYAMTPAADRSDLEAQGLILSPREGRKAILEMPKIVFNAPTTTTSPIETVDGAQLDFSTMSVKELGQVDVMTLSQADLIAMNARYTELRTSK
tara:strand:- start:738 stop:2339 length:1602 start_codon:yes stop_codon:yes gene_type:complete